MKESSPLIVDKLIPGGQGIATLENGQKVFLWNALPGETVFEYTITKRKSHYLEAIATKIATPSPHRITPMDSCYLSTSPWQIMTYEYELQQKLSILIEQFRQFDIDISQTTTAVKTDGESLHYRNKMEYALYWDHEQQKISLAFHNRGSHHKIPVSQSSIEMPQIFAEAQKIVDELNAKHEEARKYQSLLLRANQSGTVSGGLYVNRQPHPVFNQLTDTILGQEYSYSPNGFFQINLPVYEMALEEISKHIQTTDILDLYSGVGTIGLSVLRQLSEPANLTLVEIDNSAYSELEKNCANLPNALPVHAKSEGVLEYIQPNQTVILDPPRAGCDEKLIQRILDVEPESVIYLSCNPATQARDVAMLLAKYTITHVQPFNFFPRTPHLENLIVLKRH